MARLNATGPPVSVANNHGQDEDQDEVMEEGNWKHFVYTEQLTADSVMAEDQGETQYSLLLREQLDGEQEDTEEDEEDVGDDVLNVVNNSTSTPRAPNRALEEDEPQQNLLLSLRKRATGMISEGIRLLGSGSRANDNHITEDTIPPEARDDVRQRLFTTTSSRKTPKKLSRPSVLHQPLNTYKPPPQSSGRRDVYEVNESPEKAASTPTRTKPRQSQGVKSKRNDPAAAKKPPRRKAPSPGLLETVSKEPAELQPQVTARVTRSRGSGEIIEPIDYSRKVEGTGKRKRGRFTTDEEPASKGSRRRNKKAVEDETVESEDEDKPGTPSQQNRSEEGIPAEEASSPPPLQRTYPKDKSRETTPSASDKGSQSGVASELPDATKGKDAAVEDKEGFDDQEHQDDGTDAEDGEEEDPEFLREVMSPAEATNINRERRREQEVPINSPYFGDDFIAESNSDRIIELVDKLEMAKSSSNDEEILREADTDPGKEVQVLTRNIISSYKSIQGLDEHDDPDPAARTEALCSAASDLERLEFTVQWIIKKRLCDPAELSAHNRDKGEEWRESMLKDLFLVIMPDIIRTASAAIFTYGSEGPPSTFDLQEILRFITLVSRLLLVAEGPQNINHRPKAAHNAGRPVLKPYTSIKPLLRGFEMQCKKELEYREQAAEARRLAPILERERREREEAERLAEEEAQIEHLRRQEAINVEYNRERMKFGLPPVPLAGTQMPQNFQSSEPPQPSEPGQKQELNITAHRIRAELEVSVLAKEVDELTKKLEVAERLATKLRREEQRQLKGYDADDMHEVDYERVEMFPAGNNHAPAAEPWTRTEYEVLTDGLRLETGTSRLQLCCLFPFTNLCVGPDKYPNIARRLDRSLDEIFEKAMEFKRVTIEGLYVKHGIPVEPWIEIIGNEMLPKGIK